MPTRNEVNVVQKYLGQVYVDKGFARKALRALLEESSMILAACAASAASFFLFLLFYK